MYILSMNPEGHSKQTSEFAPVRNIGQYFSQQNRHLVIPPWQREYVWQIGDSGEVGDLLNDLKEFLDSDSPDYWLGSVILSEESPGSKNSWLIDGQQRSLTLLIFIMAARRFMTNAKLLDGTKEQHNRLMTLCSDSISGTPNSYTPRISMDRGKADSILQSIYVWSGLPDEEKFRELLEDKETWTQTQKNLANVAEWIYEEKFKKNWIAHDKFVDSIDRIMNHVKIVEMHLPSIQDALLVFDRINNRGADLNSADLIKNRIFQHETDSTFTEITEDWREMRKTLGNCSLTRLKDPTYLLRALAVIRQGTEKNLAQEPLKQGRKITYNELTRFWSDRLDPKKSSDPRIVHLKSNELVSQLLESSKWLTDLSNEKRPHSKQSEFKNLYFSRYLKIVQHYPVLLAGRHLEKDVFAHLVNQVHARTSFYFLSGERTQEFENLVPEWSFDIASLDSDANVDAIKDIYSRYSISEKNFVDLEQALTHWSYKDGTEKRKIRAVLSQLSRVLDELCDKEMRKSPEAYFEVAKKGSKHGWDIDHIEARRSDPKESIYHSIGNLVLLHPIDNRSKGRAKVRDKEANYSECSLILTKTLVGVRANPDKRKVEKYFNEIDTDFAFDLQNWDENQIKKRSKFYFELLRHHLTVE